MKETFGALLWSSFKQVYGPAATVLSIPSAIVVWIFLPTQNVPLAYIVILGYFMIILMSTLVDATYKGLEASKVEFPHIINSKRDQLTGDLRCILEPSRFFSHGIIVSFYYIDPDGYEINIGLGQVILIQRDGKIQVSLTQPTAGRENILDEFEHNNENIKNKIYIKPTMNSDMLPR
jgi:hypothetical protein